MRLHPGALRVPSELRMGGDAPVPADYAGTVPRPPPPVLHRRTGARTRDAILLIQALCAQAVAAGVDTAAALREVAMMSSDADRYGWGTTRGLLLRSIA